mmetsp:Transcript_56984/g.68201  ORF Transcript_56984/g.68201 Transcript_56984/m.68201 type:complete len:233 (+) Transcript_56984:1140-1838(+)
MGDDGFFVRLLSRFAMRCDTFIRDITPPTLLAPPKLDFIGADFTLFAAVTFLLSPRPVMRCETLSPDRIFEELLFVPKELFARGDAPLFDGLSFTREDRFARAILECKDSFPLFSIFSFSSIRPSFSFRQVVATDLSSHCCFLPPSERDLTLPPLFFFVNPFFNLYTSRDGKGLTTPSSMFVIVSDVMADISSNEGAFLITFLSVFLRKDVLKTLKCCSAFVDCLFPALVMT